MTLCHVEGRILPRSISVEPYPRPFGRWKPLPQGDMVFVFLIYVNRLSIHKNSPGKQYNFAPKGTEC